MKCNRSACQKEGALWFNYSTRAWYCAQCARKINEGNPGLCEYISSGIAPTKTYSEWAAERGVSPTSAEVSGMGFTYPGDALGNPIPQDLQHLVYDGMGNEELGLAGGSVRP